MRTPERTSHHVDVVPLDIFSENLHVVRIHLHRNNPCCRILVGEKHRHIPDIGACIDDGLMGRGQFAVTVPPAERGPKHP